MAALEPSSRPRGFWEALVALALENRLVVYVLTVLLVLGGLSVEPLGWAPEGLPTDPVAVDAIPDIGENQQIVFTSWEGRSPQDVEDQVTYPLTTELLGLAGVRTVRSTSMFGFSSISVIFEDGVDFYWSRSRLLEKLSALPPDALPPGVGPVLGPDATALGQVFWYTLEGRDPQTQEPVPGWDLHELRALQDFTVRYALQAVPGVAEVASVGGRAMEYQVDLRPERLAAYSIALSEVGGAIAASNRDVGARTLEINQVEYILRGVGQIKSLRDVEQVVVATRQGRAIRVSDLGHVHLGPATRRGALDVAGAEAVGGVVAARFGANPVEVIESLKAAIAQLSPSLPERVLEDGRRSKVTVVPFYDRSVVVGQTLDTLSQTLVQQLLITALVVVLLMGHVRSALPVCALLPLAVLASFGLMKLFGVTANVMSLAGIAIAIGTMVDMGIVLVENMVASLEEEHGGEPRLGRIARAAAEVAPAVATSAATTIVSFLPVFGLTAAEGKLFGPLAFAKTFALLGSLALAILVLPTLAGALIWPGGRKKAHRTAALWRDGALAALGLGLAVAGLPLWGGMAFALGALGAARRLVPGEKAARALLGVEVAVASVAALVWLTQAWMPLGAGAKWWENFGLVAGVCLGLVGAFWVFLKVYGRLLGWVLEYKVAFALGPLLLVAWGVTAWLGFEQVAGWLPRAVRLSPPGVWAAHAMPGFGDEFMPPFDEGQFLYMPTTMPHASLGQALDQLQTMDALIAQVPEVQTVVGKLGRAETALDPAPISMFETLITYKPEWGVGAEGTRVRQWRDHIRSPQDIWQEITQAASMPGVTGAPQLMPIQTRIVMLQSGMRAPMGLKVRGPSLEAIQDAAGRLEAVLRQVPLIRAETVFAERVVGKPYLEIEVDRDKLVQYGVAVDQVQDAIQIALGGKAVTRVIQGRQRFALSVRYMREQRQGLDAITRVLVTAKGGGQVPLGQVATVRIVSGPQMIKSEDTFLTGLVTFGGQPGAAEVEVVKAAQATLLARLEAGTLQLPQGITYTFAGDYENQLRSQARLKVLVPLALVLIFLILYLQFRRPSTALIIYSGVAVAVSGAFILLWLYQQPWFLDVEVFGHPARTLFGVGPMNLSVAVWVGVIALVGIATDDGVVMATYLGQRWALGAPQTVAEIRQAVLEAGQRRIRPCLMTTATTLLALLPVLTSTGRGSDVMIPMAIPCVGGMAVELMTLFVVPMLYCAREETRLWWRSRGGEPS